ncbi:MAG: hypothetical protein HFE35_04905 [Clostridia bacterium]|jgi:hypothetical protein|nr:hypothetical protein [Clostridia bacterium]
MKVIDIGAAKIGVAEKGDKPLKNGVADAVLVAETLKNEVSLGSEIAGASDFARKWAAVSNECGCPVLCGCTTRFGSLRHISVMTFSGGVLADIADRTLNLCGGGYGEGDTIKVLRFKNFDFGLLVDTDILLAKNWKKIAPVCDVIVGIAFSGGDADFGFIPTYASLFGKPYAVAFASGEVLWGNPLEGLNK